ncbi:outer membrane protein assembly factor BamD [Chitinivorax tropicus]|uniref:Outer membrane protein assembly factor BamD n=1 Tax=Chitinivorax tropicus TaxID=714531 RepID=A0A840MQ32_9PROT|nr:outer membrane protein assembly factor BamD [Chitinivorax tropicus]MBB5019167.1 outer membrane protein assembly factor BamD [Chitinivorax tropicus]
MKRIVAASRIALLSLTLIAGCGLLPEQQDETAKWGPDKIYSEAKEALDGGNTQRAITLFEKLEARYPYGRYAQQAQLEIAYAHYKEGEPALAIAACDRFIKMHPTHPNVDYAFYLKGVVNFLQDDGLLSRINRQDMTERDPKSTRESFDAFKELVQRFPSSKYAPDAVERMDKLVNALAQHEIHVARYYLNRNAPLAAVNRASDVLKSFPQTSAVEDALAIMMQGYEALGQAKLRDDTRRVLEKNYPQSKYLSGGDEKKSFWKIF